MRCGIHFSQREAVRCDMKKENFLWGLGGFAFTSLAGTFLHFLYELSGKKFWASVVSGVNESTWEHMKLLFFPMLLFAAVQYFFYGDRKDFWCVQLQSILTGLTLIPVLFYTYNGAVGKSPDWLNISIFFISAFFAYRRGAKLLSKSALPCRFSLLSLVILCGIAVLFVIFTFYPPEIGLFLDPVSGTYGIEKMA